MKPPWSRASLKRVTGCGFRRDDEFVGFRAVGIGKVVHHYFERGAAQEFFEAQVHFPGEVGRGVPGAGGGFFAGGEFAVVFAAAGGSPKIS